MTLSNIIKIAILIIVSLLLWCFAPQLRFGNLAPFANWLPLASLVILIFGGGLIKIFSWVKVKGFLRFTVLKAWLLQKLADKNEAEQAAQKKAQEYRRTISERAQRVFYALKFLFKEKRRKHLKNVPWYIVLGEENSGKSMLLEQSGLDFSYSENLKIEDIREHLSFADSFKWHFSREGILIEVTQTEAEEAYAHEAQTDLQAEKIKARADLFGLLRLLKKCRRGLPINGVIVSVDLIEFLAKDTLQIQNYSCSINRYIKELAQHFKLKVPVYLVFTKCDLLAGFGEFFNDLTPEEHNQILGITLPLDHHSDGKSVAAFLAAEFDKLIAALNGRVLSRLAEESSLRRRELILCFPQQLQLCKAVISKFIVQTFTVDGGDQSKESSGAQFRGFYLTSGQQSGRPQDVLMSVMADKLNLEKMQLPEQLINSQSYFISGLFKELIFPEAALVGNALRVNICKHRMAYVFMPVLLLFGAVGVWMSYNANLLGGEQASDQVNYYKQLLSKVPLQDMHLTNVLPALNALQEVMPVYKNIPHSWLLLAGLSTSLLVDQAAEQMLHNQLQTILMPRVKSYLEALIRSDMEKNKAYDLYNDLKGYLALNLTDKIAPFWIEPPLFAGLDNDLVVSQTQKQALKKFIEMAMHDGFRKQELNSQLVAAARNKLRQISLAKRAYWYLKEKDLFGQQKGIDINDKVGSNLEEVFANSDQTPIIPVFFSTIGFEYLYRKSDKEAVDEIASSDLVMGINHVRLSKAEKEHMSEALRDIYANEYYQQWYEALSTLGIVDFQDLDHALRVLEILSGSASPIPRLLSLVNINTEPLVHANLGANKFFKILDRVIQQQGAEYVQLAEINKTLNKLHDFVAKIANESEPRAIYQTSVDLMNGAIKGDPITQLYNQAQSLPAPLNQWYTRIAQNSLQVILQAARQVINNDWKANVIGEYQENLAGRYPLDSSASAEVSLENFSHFFAPQGTFDAFYQKDLQGFIDNKNWRLKTRLGQNIGIPEQQFKQIIKLVNIRDKYFSDGSKQPHLKFVVKPITLTELAARVELRLGSQSLNYAHGPQRGYAWQWPVSGDAQETSVVFSLFSGSTPSGGVYQGNWAWFRLLTNSAIHSDASDTYYFTVQASDGSYAGFKIVSPVGLGAFNLEWLSSLALSEQL